MRTTVSGLRQAAARATYFTAEKILNTLAIAFTAVISEQWLRWVSFR